MEVFGWVEPEMKPHFPPYKSSISTSLHVHVGLQGVRLIQCGSEELDIDFVVVTGIVFLVRKLSLPTK